MCSPLRLGLKLRIFENRQKTLIFFDISFLISEILRTLFNIQFWLNYSTQNKENLNSVVNFASLDTHGGTGGIKVVD